MPSSVIKENPRSSGVLNGHTYIKTSTEVDLIQEARELQRCALENIATDHIRPVKFLSYEPDTNTLETERISGHELYHTLWNPTYWLGKLRGKKLPDEDVLFSNIAELGTWLKMYHNSSTTDELSAEAKTWLTNSFQEKLNGMLKLRLINSELAERIQRRFINGLDLSERTDSPFKKHYKFCQLHGDFIIYNIKVDPDLNLHVLDFGDSRQGCNLEDIARFYSGLWAMAQTNNERKRLFLPLLEQFLAAYGLPNDIIHDEFFKANLAYNYITHRYGQHFMKELVSWNSYIELNQISNKGLQWVKKECNGFL